MHKDGHCETGTPSRARWEAFAAVNENAQARAASLPLVEQIFCGMRERGDANVNNSVSYTPPFMRHGGHVEELDLFDARYVRDTGKFPARFSMHMEVWRSSVRGRGMVVDLGYSATVQSPLDAPHSPLHALRAMNEARMNVTNRLYEHAHALDAVGHLSVGYLECVLDHVMQNFGEIDLLPTFSTLDMYSLMIYNSPLYFAHVQRVMASFQVVDRTAGTLAERQPTRQPEATSAVHVPTSPGALHASLVGSAQTVAAVSHQHPPRRTWRNAQGSAAWPPHQSGGCG